MKRILIGIHCRVVQSPPRETCTFLAVAGKVEDEGRDHQLPEQQAEGDEDGRTPVVLPDPFALELGAVGDHLTTVGAPVGCRNHSTLDSK